MQSLDRFPICDWHPAGPDYRAPRMTGGEYTVEDFRLTAFDGEISFASLTLEIDVDRDGEWFVRSAFTDSRQYSSASDDEFGRVMFAAILATVEKSHVEVINAFCIGG